MTYVPREEDIDDYRREAAEDRANKHRHACQCTGDMPGTCPGPENCPMAFGYELEGEI